MTTLPFRALFAVVLCAAMSSCTKHQAGDDEGDSAGGNAVVAVRTAPVIRGDMPTIVSATGSTDAVRKEKIIAPIAGTLLSMKVLEGDRVSHGAVVAVIQPKEARAAILGAETLQRAARTDAERAEARRARELALAGQNTLEVHAASDGVVATRSVTEGELVSENTELMTVVDLSTLVFLADVPLHDVAQVRPGERASVMFQSLPGRRFGAVVDAVNPRSDPQSQTVRVRLRFTVEEGDRKPLLRTDMSGVARIVTGTHPGVLIVPKEALLRNDETDVTTVVVATADSVAKVVQVSVGARTDTTAEVSGAGLEPGALVVVEGNYALADSTRIAPAR